MGFVEISHSRVQTYERCPWLYHLVYDEGWRAGPSAPAALGQSIHRALDAYLAKTNADKSLEALLELFDHHWVNEGFGTPQQTFEAYERGRQILTNFHSIDGKRTSSVVGTEVQFDYEIASDVHFRGTVDRLDKHADGSYEVIEYKTMAEPWAPERVAKDRQMTFYALGLSHKLDGASLKLTYYFLSSGASVVTTRTQQQLEEAHALILDTAGKIRRQEYAPNHASCARCEFGRRCKHFKPS